ncbi:MAG: transcriptional repressor [Vicinamibacteria bacterium]
MRYSLQRDVVLEVVRSIFEHPTADWVYKTTRKRLPKVGLGTVYRNLKALVDEGLVREVRTDDEAVRYDGNVGEHYHIRCIACGRVSDLPVSVDRSIEAQAHRATNYAIVGHATEVQGVCPSCQKISHSEREQLSNQRREHEGKK